MPGEEAQLDQLCLLRFHGSEAGQCVIEIEQSLRRLADAMGFLESHTPSVAAMTQGSLAAGHFDENSPHRFGGSSEEVTSPVELQVPDQPKVCLVHKTGGNS